VSKPEFRNASGARYLSALFLERNMRDKSVVLYTLKETDDGYPSLYRLYMESNDPTEYTFATTYFENWQHWADLCECNWFIPIVRRWREEKELKFRSQSLAILLRQALEGTREAVQVNKWIVEGGYTPKNKGGSTGRGRPSKEDISKAASQIAGDQTRLDEDYLRIVQ
jgi:hypothetical protein